MNDIEKLFKDDIREKKVAGRGIFSRVATRKGGAKGGDRTPYGMLSQYQKKQYEAAVAGEVKTYFMEELDIKYVKDIKEIEAMSPEDGRNYLIRVKGIYTCKQLREHWKLKSDYYLYGKLYKKFNVPLEKGIGGNRRNKKNASEIAKEVIAEATKELAVNSEEVPSVEEKKVVEKNSMCISLSGTFDGEEAAKRIQTLANLMQNGKEYKVYLSITE